MLPLIQAPTFKTVIPSTGHEVMMRPFVVKEEKILLLAKQSNDKDQIFLSVQQVVQNCLIDHEYDVSKLPFFDVEYLFIQLRLNSIGDSITFKMVDDETDKEVEASVDLNDLEVVGGDVTTQVEISQDTFINFKYPTMKDLSKLDTDSEVSSFFDLLKHCIDTVIHEDTVYDFDLYGDEEKNQFIESMSMEHLNKCKEFVSSLPSIQITAKWKSGKEVKEKIIKGMNSFF